jgi:malonate transporter and related proteins
LDKQMTSAIIGALLPIVVTLLLGFAAGWHHDFDVKQASILNRMVMLYALPLSLFAGLLGTPRDRVLGQGMLALWVFLAMIVPYALVVVLARYVLHRDLMTSALQALTIAGPAAPFVGVSVLGHLFGSASAIPISVAGLAMNLVQVPATLMLLSAGRQVDTSSQKTPTFASHILHALKEPVVWAPLLAFILVLAGVKFPGTIGDSLALLGKATGGVALFASGIVLFSRRVAVSLATCISVVARNVAIPGATWGLARVAGLPPDIIREVVLTIAIPTASLSVILAVQYQTAEQEMASSLFFSTILSVLTMGAFIWLVP